MDTSDEPKQPAVESREGDQRVVVIDLMRPRPDSRPRGSLGEKVGAAVGLVVVAGLLGVPFELLSNVLPKDVWLLLFLAWAYASFTLYGYISDGLVERLELLIARHGVVVISSKVGEVGRVRYDQLHELIVFDDEWYNGSKLLRWQGVILEVKGEIPLELELGEHTQRVAQLMSQRTGVELQRERVVWPAAPEFD